mgnify:CR=1 FL=1
MTRRTYGMDAPRRLVVRVPGALWTRLEDASRAAGVTVSEYTRRALAARLEESPCDDP